MATTRSSSSSGGTRKRAPSGKQGAGKSSGETSAVAVARAAGQQLAELTGRPPESVVGIERTEDGWRVELEVVESRRIPDSTDILATYSVQVDRSGELLGYHRVRRYVRGKGGDGDGGHR